MINFAQREASTLQSNAICNEFLAQKKRANTIVLLESFSKHLQTSHVYKDCKACI